MSVVCDLHTYSTASDGQHTPTELVKLAKQRGLEVLALTGHDTLDGVKDAIQVGKESEIRVIPGVN